MNDVDEFLEHHGIKGMQWGVRTKRNNMQVNASEDSKRASDIRAKAKTGTVRSLTNDEIRAFTTRAQLENSFANATPSNMKKVMSFVKDILGVKSTMDQVINFENSSSGKAIREGLAKRNTSQAKISRLRKMANK